MNFGIGRMKGKQESELVAFGAVEWVSTLLIELSPKKSRYLPHLLSGHYSGQLSNGPLIQLSHN